MKKKVLSLFFAFTLAASLLAGCGGGSGGDGSGGSGGEGGGAVSDGETTTTSVGEYSADNPYHCVFSFVDVYPQDSAARQAVQDALNEYMIPKYHIEVEFMPLQIASYQSDIQLMISGGDEVDVIPVFYTQASSLIAMDGIVDMKPYMESEDGKKIIENLGEANAYVGSMNGVLFGFPAQKESVELGGLFMRADVCDELGITEKYGLKKNDDQYTGKIYSWDVATEIFKEVKEKKPEMYPLYLQGNQSQLARFMMWDSLADNFGTLNWEKDHTSTKVENLYESEEFKKAVTRLAEWFDAGYIYKDALTSQDGSSTMMKGGNTFSYATAIKPGFLVEAAASNGCEGYAMYFGNYIEGGWTTTNVSFFDTGIATNSKDPEMAFKFISALYSDPEVGNFWLNGIKDVNYQVKDDGTAYFVDGEDPANYKYHLGIGWELGNQFITYVWNDGTKKADYWDLLQSHNDWASYSPAYGFMWDSSEYANEIAALQTALETYRPSLETGACGAANVEKTIADLNKKLYDAGLQKVMDAKQTQLDEWLKTNGPTETPQKNLDTIKSVTTGVLTAPQP